MPEPTTRVSDMTPRELERHYYATHDGGLFSNNIAALRDTILALATDPEGRGNE